MLDEERVHGDPVLPGEHLAQALLRLLRRPSADDAEPVRDPVDVGVDRDRRLSVAEDQHAVRGLGSDPGQRQQLLHRAGHLARESREDLARAVPDRAGFGVVESRLPDQRLDRRRSCAGQSRRVREPREQAGARDLRRRVPSALGEDGADEHLERVLRVVAEVRRPPVPGVVERGEPVEHRHPIERTSGRHRPPLRFVGAAAGSGRGPVPGSDRSGSSFPPWVARASSPIR